MQASRAELIFAMIISRRRDLVSGTG